MGVRNERSRHLVRIRIFSIIGFSGFYRLVFDWHALVRTRLVVISKLWRKPQVRRNEILKIPLIL